MIPLKEYLDVVMTCRPMKIITSHQHKLITTDAEWQSEGAFVIENDPDTIGMAGVRLDPLTDGDYRIWRRSDWELCDNKRREAVTRMNNIEAQRREKHAIMLAALKADLVSKGATQQVVDMLFNALSGAQLETMYKNITPATTSPIQHTGALPL